MCCFWALYVLHLNVICIIFGYHACALIIVVYTRTHEKRAKVQKFSHIRKQKQQNFFFSFFLPPPPALFPCSLRPLSSSLFPRSPYPLFTPKSQYASTYSRHIPDTYPTHTRYIRIFHEYSTNTPRISHEYPIRQKKGREKEEKAPLFNRPHAFFLAYFKKKSYLCTFNSKCTIDNS